MNGKRPSARPAAENINLLKEELRGLQENVARDASNFGAKSKTQGCLGLGIMISCTLIGVIVGFGVLSIFTGIGGWLIGVQIASAVAQDSPAQAAFEAKTKRIKEIELTLSKLSE